MPRGFCGVPAYTVRTQSVEDFSTWLKEQTAKQLGDPTSELSFRLARERYEAEKRKEREDEQARIAAQWARRRANEAAERRVAEQWTFDLMLADLFEGATDVERTRVTRLVEQKHGKDCTDIDLWSMTLRLLRETMQGNDNGPDWHGELREVSRRKDA